MAVQLSSGVFWGFAPNPSRDVVYLPSTEKFLASAHEIQSNSQNITAKLIPYASELNLFENKLTSVLYYMRIMCFIKTIRLQTKDAQICIAANW